MNGSRACALDIAMAHGSACASAECFMLGSDDYGSVGRLECHVAVLVVIRGRFSVAECVSRTDGYGGDRGVSRVLAYGFDGDVGCGHAEDVPACRTTCRGSTPACEPRRSPDPPSPDPPPPPPAPRRAACTDRTTVGRTVSRRSGSPPRSANRTRPPRTRCTPPRRYGSPTGPDQAVHVHILSDAPVPLSVPRHRVSGCARTSADPRTIADSSLSQRVKPTPPCVRAGSRDGARSRPRPSPARRSAARSTRHRR